MAGSKSFPTSIRRLCILSWIGCTGCLGMSGLGGCASSRYLADAPPTVAPEHFTPVEAIAIAGQITDAVRPNPSQPNTVSQSATVAKLASVPAATPRVPANPTEASAEVTLQTVTHETTPGVSKIEQASAKSNVVVPPAMGKLTIDGREVQIRLDESAPQSNEVANANHSLIMLAEPNSIETTTYAMSDSAIEGTPSPLDSGAIAYDVPIIEEGSLVYPSMTTVGGFAPNIVDLNLPSALAMIDAKHPAVGLAQWRVQEAYARLSQAEVLWLPTIQAGFSLHRHDGNYQASNGQIVDVDRNSLQYGLGTGATGAGTTQRPGLVAQFHLADAIFEPNIAEKTAWARGHAARAVVNEQLLRVALAYNDLLNAHQDVRIVEESRDRMNELYKITDDFAQAGEGLRADADRVQTELMLIESRVLGVQESIAIASARLAQALSIDAANTIVPLDATVVPLDLAPIDSDKSGLIQMGLTTRPELKESQALVAAACEAYQREKYAPMVPSVLLGFSTGGFGGGLGSDLENSSGRYDFDALVSWEVRNLGFGEKAARRLTSSRVEQAKFEKLGIMDEVARQVSEAHAKLDFRRQQMSLTQAAIETAQQSYNRNLARIRDGQGLPIEVLQSVEALEVARRSYLKSVIDYNESQFQLQWALGWPVSQG